MTKQTDFNKQSSDQQLKENQDRRSFLKSSASAATVAMTVGSAAASLHPHASAAEPKSLESINVALVGCGGRGKGALRDSLAINKNIRVIAMADLEMKQCEQAKKMLKDRHPEAEHVDKKNVHIGLDAYKKVLANKDVNVVFFTTSPGFRPYHIKEAVDAGKHVFAEKPTCVDPAGYKVCLAAHEKAKANGTAIVTGTQYRRQVNYIGAIEKIRQGLIGDIVSATSRYCSTGIWYRARKDGMSDLEYQLHNWMHFIWLSGDQIAEQAVHNIDAMNWVMNSNPETAYGSGGRFTRPSDSQMYDSVSIDYVYPGNRVLSFMCRQIPGTDGDNGNVIFGTEGTCYIGAGSSGSRIVDRKGKEVWKMEGKISDAYKQEHKDLVDSIRAGRPIVELKQTADSSLTAVMGRMAAYTGKRVSWDFVTNKSKLDLFPKKFKMDGSMPESKYAIPGKTKLI